MDLKWTCSISLGSFNS